jgi:hypothetical protein
MHCKSAIQRMLLSSGKSPQPILTDPTPTSTLTGPRSTVHFKPKALLPHLSEGLHTPQSPPSTTALFIPLPYLYHYPLFIESGALLAALDYLGEAVAETVFPPESGQSAAPAAPQPPSAPIVDSAAPAPRCPQCQTRRVRGCTLQLEAVAETVSLSGDEQSTPSTTTLFTPLHCLYRPTALLSALSAPRNLPGSGAARSSWRQVKMVHLGN